MQVDDQPGSGSTPGVQGAIVYWQKEEDWARGEVKNLEAYKNPV